jgi:hypothetical protein
LVAAVEDAQILKSHRPAGSAVTPGAPAADRKPAMSLYSASTRFADVTEVADGLCVGPSSEGLVEGVEVVDCGSGVPVGVTAVSPKLK